MKNDPVHSLFSKFILFLNQRSQFACVRERVLSTYCNYDMSNIKEGLMKPLVCFQFNLAVVHSGYNLLCGKSVPRSPPQISSVSSFNRIIIISTFPFRNYSECNCMVLFRIMLASKSNHKCKKLDMGYSESLVFSFSFLYGLINTMTNNDICNTLFFIC